MICVTMMLIIVEKPVQELGTHQVMMDRGGRGVSPFKT